MRRILRSSVLFMLALSLVPPVDVHAQAPAIDTARLRLPGVARPAIAIPRSGTAGTVEVVVQLTGEPLAVANGLNAKQRGARLDRAAQRERLRQLAQEQDAFVERVRGLRAQETARLNKALNAVVIKIDASRLKAVAALPGVRSVRPVIDYKLDLSETVPYIGAAAVQAAGRDGTGVTVAVLDSGIDYTHRNLGGAGTLPAYQAAYGASTGDPLNTTLDGLFPTAKVVAGFDFVGEQWPNGERTEDPDPIDFEGHGTHVADIIGGRSTDGSHRGVAPGASLLAVKVCSAVSPSCNGVALLKAIDYILDPNGDGDLADAVDVVNMSLGSSYGQREDDLSEASANAVRAGVTIVASAGNSADRPYITGSPSSTPEVISVAQTQVPGARTFPLIVNSPAAIAGSYANTETVDWAPIGSGFTDDVVYVGRGCPAGSISAGSPADPYLADPAGKIALIDRGSCSISPKADRAAKAGAKGVLIGLIAPGDAVSFSFGGGDTFVPTLVVTQSTSNLIKANLSAPVNVTVSPATSISLVGSLVGSSSRGPNFSYDAIKPDIGAPGASLSAEVGTGTGQTTFGGTSGAAPMVAGSAALLLQAYPTRSPAEIKSLLMNTAEINIQTNPSTQPGVLAPITRIGGGEVRVDRSINSLTAAWDANAATGGLSFGYKTLAQSASFSKQVLVRNYSNETRIYSIDSSFRYADDAASGAVSVQTPDFVRVAANSDATFPVVVSVDAARLPNWNLNGGSNGGNGSLLQGVEFDGYIDVADATDRVRLPWHVLPHKAAAVTPSRQIVNLINGAGSLTLSNAGGATPGRVEVFSLTGVSPKIAREALPADGDNFAVIDLKSVGVRQSGSNLEFAVTTFGERSHPNYPAQFNIEIDTNRDGTTDYIVYNGELSGFAATGQNVVYVLRAGTTTATAYFFTDADLNSANAILTVPFSALGLTAGSQFNFAVSASDNYFTGNFTDSIGAMTYTAATPRYTATGVPAEGVPVGGSGILNVQAVSGGETASPSQSGLLLLYRDAKLKQEADAVLVTR